MMKPGKPVHPSNGVGTAPDGSSSPEGVEVSFDGGPNRTRASTMGVLITNTDVANSLEVSFADGRDGTFFSIPFGVTITFPVAVHRCRLRGAGGTATYSILGLIA